MKEPKQNVLYRHAPVNVNGKPLLVQNLWNFKLGSDGLMHNTKCKDFVLPWDEYEFTEIFDFEKMDYRPWTELYESYPPNTVFVEGRDVQTGKSPSLKPFCYVRCNAEPEPLPRLRQLYEQYCQRLKQYQVAKHYYEKAKNQFLKEYPVPDNMTFEDYLESTETDNIPF